MKFGIFLVLIICFLYTPKALLSSASYGETLEVTASVKTVIRKRMEWIEKHTKYDSDVPLPRIIILEMKEVQYLRRSWGQYFLTVLRHSAFFNSSQQRILALMQAELGLMDDPKWRILAFYTSTNNTIYMGREYSKDNDARKRHPETVFYIRPRWSSILVHELVHYLQDVSEVKSPSCSGLKELQAYHLERKWMAMNTGEPPRRIPYKKIITTGC